MKRDVMALTCIMLLLQSCAQSAIKTTLINQPDDQGQGTEIIDFSGINAYLVKTSDGFIMIDTGVSAQRAELEKVLAAAGCNPGGLKLIILTHGDVDHVNNSAYLCEKYGAKIAMNEGDVEVVQTGNMGLNRKAKPDKESFLFNIIMFFGKKEKFETFTPDILLKDGQSLVEYGFNAQVLSLEGHSKGSIGILTADHDLFCGDLLINFGKPAYHFMIWEMPLAKASVARIKQLPVKTIYPGHGKQFSMEELSNSKL